MEQEDRQAVPASKPQKLESSPAVASAYARLREHLDLLVAICALLTSVTSIWLSIAQGDDMARLVQAQSWPHIGFSTGNAEWNAAAARWDDRLVLAIENDGVGPAQIRSVKMRFDDLPIENSDALLAACCGYEASMRLGTREQPLVTSTSAGSVMRAGQKIELLNWQRPVPVNQAELTGQVEAAAKVWQALDATRGRIQLEVCYCSVFDECWTLRSSADTVPTATCPHDREAFYQQ
ncbi:hypothetical protein C7S18_10435 [Ahniella affigens]|uniref:Uncharacterized protein n=1 Tax=Ahniella affigens TaxID=2021234 RepID=A0A2P1PRX6_9GAMM|nr:hypothetical protein [Ahniella affigens]AVP97588.1 hypothetical protein C7S18_10435 [Ahniella affigens]